MLLDATLRGIPLSDTADWARCCERAGFDGLFVTETNNDPFLAVALAAEHTERMQLGTGIALALPRSPMQLAYTGWDMQALARGRFILGLGSQVKAHVERRFSAQWTHPRRRMSELVRAVRAIWRAWETGEELAFEGEFYRHTLMPPAFRPRPHSHPPPLIFLAGVQELMVQTAGEVGDGLLVHPLQSPRYLRETILPALERGLDRSHRRREDFQVSVALFVATSDEEAEAIRRRIAFYASTPAYQGVLRAHGWESVGSRLHQLSRSGGWSDMAGLVGDEMLDAFAVRASGPTEAAAKIGRRYHDLADRVNLHAGELSDLDGWSSVAGAMARQRSIGT